MRLRTMLGATALFSILAFGGCGDKTPPPAAAQPTAPAAVPAAAPAPAPARPAVAAPVAAPVAAQPQKPTSGVSVEAGNKGSSVKVNDGKTETEIQINKNGVEFNFHKAK